MKNIHIESSLKKLPHPSLDDPFAQIRFVCHERAALSVSDVTKEKYRNFWNLYARYLKERDGWCDSDEIRPYYIDEEFGIECHFLFSEWLKSKNWVDSNAYRSRFKQIIIHCRSMRYIGNYVYFVSVEDNYGRIPHTLSGRKAHDIEIFPHIERIISTEIAKIEKLSNPYEKTGKGRNPLQKLEVRFSHALRLFDLFKRCATEDNKCCLPFHELQKHMHDEFGIARPNVSIGKALEWLEKKGYIEILHSWKRNRRGYIRYCKERAEKTTSCFESQAKLLHILSKELDDRPGILCIGAQAKRLSKSPSSLIQSLYILRNAGFLECKRKHGLSYALSGDLKPLFPGVPQLVLNYAIKMIEVFKQNADDNGRGAPYFKELKKQILKECGLPWRLPNIQRALRWLKRSGYLHLGRVEQGTLVTLLDSNAETADLSEDAKNRQLCLLRGMAQNGSIFISSEIGVSIGLSKTIFGARMALNKLKRCGLILTKPARKQHFVILRDIESEIRESLSNISESARAVFEVLKQHSDKDKKGFISLQDLRKAIGKKVVSTVRSALQQLEAKEYIRINFLGSGTYVRLLLSRDQIAKLRAFKKGHILDKDKYAVLFSCKMLKDIEPQIRDEMNPASYGWGNIDNLQWWFENEMNCNPRIDENNPAFKHFITGLRIAAKNPDLKKLMLKNKSKIDGGEGRLTYSIFRHWGCIRKIRANIMATLMADMAMITGLNVESLKSLSIDCLRFEPLTGTYYLVYYKARSRGKKELPLWTAEDEDLADDSESAVGLFCEPGLSVKPLYYLPHVKHIQRIINIAKALTKKIRPYAPDAIAKHLFIFEARSGISVIGTNHLGWWSKWFREKIVRHLCTQARNEHPDDTPSLYEESEEKIRQQLSSYSFALSRFRSTLATRLVLQGAPLYIIKAILGHARITTTIRYLNKQQLELAIFKDVHSALNRLKKGKLEIFLHVDSNEALQHKLSTGPCQTSDGGYIFATGTPISCKDPTNPPENIRLLHKNWNKNSVCKMWNMCLLYCDKLLIIDLVLPRLIAYQGRIIDDLDKGMILKPKQNDLLLGTIKLIDEILDPQNGFFSRDTIDDARLRSEQYSWEEMTGLYYQGVGAWE